MLFSWTEASGQHVFLQQSRGTVVLSFHRLNADEADGLPSALFLSAERFHALTLSFLPVWFPWQCRPLGKKQSLAPHAQAAGVIFGVNWAVNASRNVSMNRPQQGRARMQMEGTISNCPIIERTSPPAGLQLTCHSIRNTRFILGNINLDREGGKNIT